MFVSLVDKLMSVDNELLNENRLSYERRSFEIRSRTQEARKPY